MAVTADQMTPDRACLSGVIVVMAKVAVALSYAAAMSTSSCR